MQGALQKHLLILLLDVQILITELLAVRFASPHRSLSYKQGALQNATFSYAMCVVFGLWCLEVRKGCWTKTVATPDMG